MMRLTNREKLLAAALATFVAAWGILTFAVKPAVERINTLSRVLPEKQNELKKLQTAGSEYILLRDTLDNLHAKAAAQEKELELLPFLETQLWQCGLTENAVSMKQQVTQLDQKYDELIVEIKLENITLGQLVDFLQKIDSPNMLIKTKGLYIKKSFNNTKLLDSVIEIHNAGLSQTS